MCKKCKELDEKIAHFRQFTFAALDPLTIDRIKRWLPIFSGNGIRCINRPRNDSGAASLLLTGRGRLLWRFRRALEQLYSHAVTGP